MSVCLYPLLHVYIPGTQYDESTSPAAHQTCPPSDDCMLKCSNHSYSEKKYNSIADHLNNCSSQQLIIAASNLQLIQLMEVH